MRSRDAGVRLLTAAFVLGGIGVAFIPVAHAGGAPLAPTTEAWYQPDPACGAPTGCISTGALPAAPPTTVPTTPFPAGTLHVGYAAGQETARTFLAFSVDQTGGTLSAAHLDVPLDTAPADGDLQSATAKVQVCLASGTIQPAAGSLAQPPAADCSAHAALTYAATPSPHLRADLSPLLTGLAGGSAIVLLPDATKSGPSDAWRVVFSAHDRTDAAKTPPASLTVTVSEQGAAPAPETPGAPPPAQPPAAGGTSFVAPPLSGPLAGPLPPPTTVDQTAPQVSRPAAVSPVAEPRLVTVGYAYPAVWLLPLLLLLVVPLVAKGLTRDLAPTSAAART